MHFHYSRKNFNGLLYISVNESHVDKSLSSPFKGCISCLTKKKKKKSLTILSNSTKQMFLGASDEIIWKHLFKVFCFANVFGRTARQLIIPVNLCNELHFECVIDW